MSQAIRFVPSSLTDAPAAPPDGPPRVLIFGGSQGAHAINMAMVEAAPRLAAHPGGLAVTHQTGERDLELVRDGYRARRPRSQGRAVPLRHGPRDESRGPRDLPGRRDDAGRADGGGQAVGARSAADRRRRSPAQERGSAGGGRRRRAARAVADDRGGAGASHHRPRGRPVAAASDGGRGAAAGEARRRTGDRRPRVRSFAGSSRSARTDAADSLRRYRRHRHERHRRTARQSRLRGERLGCEAIDGDRSPGAARRTLLGRTRRRACRRAPTSSWCRRRSGPATRRRPRPCGVRFRSSRGPRCWPS